MSTRAEAAGRIALAVGTAMALVLALMMVTGGTPARADHEPPDDTVAHDGQGGTNETPFWVNYLENERGIAGASCTKIEEESSEAFVMPSAPAGQVWVLLVVKQASTNFVWFDPVAGHSYPSVGDQAPGYSHVIVCSSAEPEDTTTTTTTTVPDDTTTTTEPEDTTTTTVPEETTTTVPEETTTTIEDEVLGTDVTTTTVADEVLGTDVLPFTGVPSDALALAALALIASGALTLGIARRATD